MLVLDASAAVHIVRNTEVGNALRETMLEDGEAVAPALFITEVANSLMKYVGAQHITADEARSKINIAVALIDEFEDEADYVPEVVALSEKYQHPVYDMVYLAIARRKGAILYTLDQKLQDIAAKEGVSCMHSIDW